MNNQQKYDYIIVGAGLYGSIFAHEATKAGKKCLVLERRNHIGGNCYTKRMNDINVHYYGAHIFHTSNEMVWDYMQQFCQFNHYVNSPMANYRGELYNMPFNMNTFCRLWPDVHTPDEARARIAEQQAEYAGIEEPANLEEQGMKLAGRDIYEKLVKGYSEKQWGMKAEEIPAFVLRRLPFRFTFDNNYFNDPHQGIPIGGYTPIFEKLLEGIEVRLETDFLANKDEYLSMADRVLYTGPLDAYFDFCYGHLDFRTVRFDHQVMEGVENFQGNAVFNYTDAETPYTRVLEHKHFEFGKQSDTVVSYEYSEAWHEGAEPYYPVNNERNDKLAAQYKALAAKEENVSFGGRLGEYCYYDMDKIVAQVLAHPWLQELHNTRKNIKLLICDIDGTLTDGGMYYSANGDELKKFNTRDGMAFTLLREKGIKLGLITSETTPIVERRAAKLKIDFVHQGCRFDQKVDAAEQMCKQMGISLREVAYVGDDVNCVPLLSAVGHAFCPADACAAAKAVKGVHVLSRKGGDGCVREVADNFLL